MKTPMLARTSMSLVLSVTVLVAGHAGAALAADAAETAAATPVAQVGTTLESV
jgi:hypothetical protein